jgi:hypothetical protein
MIKNPNPNPNLPHVHNDIAWLIQHVSAPQRLRLGQSRLIKVFLKLNNYKIKVHMFAYNWVYTFNGNATPIVACSRNYNC